MRIGIVDLFRAFEEFLDWKKTLAEILSAVKEVQEGQVQIMGALEDTKAALDAMSANLDNIVADEAKLQQMITDLQAQVAAGGTITEAQVQALADQATALQSRTQATADAIPD